MCDPLTAIAVASAGLQYQQGKQQQKNIEAQQKRQNEIARRNAIRRYTTEQLKIDKHWRSAETGFKQILKEEKLEQDLLQVLKLALSGSQERLMADYYRTREL